MGTSLFNQASHRDPSHVDCSCEQHDQRASIRAFPLFPASVMMHHVIGLWDHCVGIEVDAQVEQLVRDMNRSIAEADKFIQTMEKEPA